MRNFLGISESEMVIISELGMRREKNIDTPEKKIKGISKMSLMRNIFRNQGILMGYVLIFNNVKRLEDMGIVEVRKIGRETKVFITEKGFIIYKDIKQLKEDIKKGD